MAPDPSEADIAQVVDVAAVDRETACRYLKAKNNDVNAAIMAFFEGEDISQAENAMQWSEHDFGADREGNPQPASHASYGNSDFIQPLGAPTRGSTPVPSLKHPTNSDEEDAEMQQAIAASRQDATTGKQETGITSSRPPGAHFGPATKADYDPSQWAVALQGQEVVPDLEPADRVNKDGEPRCLRPLATNDYVPNLVTILHSIPLSRKALLMPDYTRSSYGQDPEWWKGHAIRMPRIVSTLDLSSAEPSTAKSDEMVAEMQRLMAMLDASARSYGSVDALLALDAVNNVTSELPADTLVDRVLHAWEISAKKTAPKRATNADIFRSLMGTTDKEGLETPYMRLIPLQISVDHERNSVTLTEALNELLWDLDDPDEEDHYIEEPAEVLCMHVLREDKSIEKAGLVIPPVFYIDPYLKDNVGATKGLRKEIVQAKERVANIDTIRQKLESLYVSESKSLVDSSLLLGHAIGHFSGQNQQAMLEERLISGADVDIELPSPPEHHEQIASQLSAVYASIKAKLDVLNEEREKTRQLLSELWQSTSQTLPTDSPKHRYWLRGVATKSHVTYVLRPRPEDAAQLNAMVDDEDAPEGLQWWRIEYDENGARITKTLAAQDDVIRAVELEEKQALIVYASDAAVAPENDDGLTDALRDFVRKDDELFSQELLIGSSGNANVSPLDNNSRRMSMDSTTVNFDNDNDLPPSYEMSDHFEYQDATRSYSFDRSPPAHEITLDGVEPENGTDVEMMEKPHESFAGHIRSSQQVDSDATMIDMEKHHTEKKENFHELTDPK